MSYQRLLDVSVVLVLIIFIAVSAYFYPKAKCNAQAISFEDHRFGIIERCMVKHDDKWLPLENIRGFD